MVLKKCSNCNKNITQKLPGLECSRCNKIVHATTICANLTNKQIASLRNAEGLEWSCEECLRNVSRRSSYFLPDDSDVEDEIKDTGRARSYDKLVSQISCETRKIVKSELQGLTTAVEYLNSQVADLEGIVKQQESTIKMLVNKNADLLKKNQNLELRVSAMEQRVLEVDQKLLCTNVEISGVPELPNMDAVSAVREVAEKLNMSSQQIVSARRTTSRRKEQPGHIVVELQSKVTCEQWISAARKQEILAGNIWTDLPVERAASRVYVRAALTPHTKALLYKARNSLSGSFKYIWCKDGRIYAKKDDTSNKVTIIRCISDIESLCEPITQ